MKTIDQLKKGKCTVVGLSNGKKRYFTGTYDDYLRIVFFTIPYHYEIIGYKQK